jgi:hypothetical protein
LTMEAAHHESPHQRGKRMLRESGYHDDAKQDEAMIHRMVKPSALKRKDGGFVDGEEPHERPDKRARGGAMRKGPRIGAVNVNVNHRDPAAEMMARQQGAQQGIRQGIAQGARLAASRAAMAGGAPRPPMGVPPVAPGGPPGMARPPMMPPGGGVPGAGLKDGGAVHVRAHTRSKAHAA